MQKICVVYSFKASAWVSCQKIVTNLLKAYEANADKYELVHVNFANRINDYDFITSGQKVLDAKPDTIIFLDHQPHPVYFLVWLTREFKEIKLNPSYVFHLYGDFSLTFYEWNLMERLIDKSMVTWYAASERQRNMLTEFIPEEQLQICPFPVDPKEFNWKGKRNDAFRREQGWGSDETVFIFTGRLSRQKRIHQLVEAFAEWRQATDANARLVLVGDPDKVGEPWLGASEYEGEYFHRLNAQWHNLPESEQARVQYYGFRPNKQLPDFYQAADCLVNISVHNDEDYGMTCAEAQACGLPLILTDWAGFQGFQRPGLKDEITLVPVKIAPRGKLIKLAALKSAFQKMHEEARGMDRDKISRVSLEWTSVENAASIVANNAANLRPFSKFTPLIAEAAQRQYMQKGTTFADFKKRTYNDLYFKVYRHYVGKA